jgi:uncharacterized protein (UPF0216 family)
MVDQLAIEKLIQSMNRHVPAKRSSLEQLLEQEEPNYRGKDGTEYSLKRNELEKIASLLDERERRKLRLPIYISTDTTYPGGAWKIRGRIEVKVVSNLIKREPEKDDEMRLFFPHVNDLRKILPTATTVLYMP